MRGDRLGYFLGGGLLLLLTVLLLRPAQSSSLDIGFHVRTASGPAARAKPPGLQDDSQGLVANYDVAGLPTSPRSGCFEAARISGAQVRAFGAYEGGASTSLSFAGEGNEVRRINLQADETGPPLILVFTAYSPVVWNFSGVPVKRLRGVLVYGEEPQAVANLNESVPVRFVLASQGVTPCGRSHFAHKSTTELGALRAQVRAVLGVPVAEFTGSYNPEAIQVDGGSFRAVEDKPIKASDVRSGAPLQLGGLPPGDQGLRILVARGDLRPATAGDLALWKSRADPRTQTVYLEETWVVVRQTTLPRGMEGMNRRFFFIPNGVPLPLNPGIHNGFYRLENGSCSGFC
jgi:hypothetical protein